MCRDIGARCPALLDNSKAHPDAYKESAPGQVSSLGVFLNQEVSRMNGLLKVVKSTLDQLDRAIAGTVVMSAALEDMMNRMLDDKVPTQWEAVGFPSLKPLASWVLDLIERVAFLGSWLYGGLPATYWVPAFFFPQGFMTAEMQTYARKNETPINALQFKTNVLPFMADQAT